MTTTTTYMYFAELIAKFLLIQILCPCVSCASSSSLQKDYQCLQFLATRLYSKTHKAAAIKFTFDED